MQYISYKWLEEPEKYFPEPKTIVNYIKWHIALYKKAHEINREINHEAYKKELVCLADIISSPEAESLRKRDYEYISNLGYENVARIEAAMLIGRELWYKNRNAGYSDYDEELREYKLSDLDAWMKVFDIPPSIAAGGDNNAATEYTLSKRPDFLQTYIDSLEGSECG